MDPYNFRKNYAYYAGKVQDYPVRKQNKVRQENWDTTQHDLNQYKLTPSEIKMRKAQRAPKQRYNEPLISKASHATEYLYNIYESPDEGENIVKHHLDYLLNEREDSLRQKDISTDKIVEELEALKKKVIELSTSAKYAEFSQQYAEKYPQYKAEERPQLGDLNPILLEYVNKLTERMSSLYVNYNLFSDEIEQLKRENKEMKQQLENLEGETYAERAIDYAADLAELDAVLEYMRII